MKNQKLYARGVLCAIMAGAGFLWAAQTASAAVTQVRAVPWQGDPNKYHTAVDEGTPQSPTWNTSSDNALRVRSAGNSYVSWVRATITAGGSTQTVCLFDYAGGNCTVTNLCSANYTGGAFDQTTTIAASPAPDSITFEVLGTGCSSPGTVEILQNGVSLGGGVLNPVYDCTCSPPVRDLGALTPVQGAEPGALLKGVIDTSDTNTVWYQWDFGDGSKSAVTALSGQRRYNVEKRHAYSGAAGTPFNAKLLVDAVDNTMVNATVDSYRLKLEVNNLDAQVNKAIDDGLWYLYTHQRSGITSTNSKPMTSWESYSYFYPSATGAVIQAFEINNHKESNHDGAGNFPEDPYAEAVAAGLNWLLNGKEGGQNILGSFAIGQQTNGNPDSNGNGKGIQVEYSGEPAYQGGLIMDAIISSGTPSADSGRDFDGDGQTDTYKKVVQDMVDAYAWGQSDWTAGADWATGWGYNWNQGDTDNSTNQWAAIGLIPAEQNFGCTIPQFVKDNMNRSLNYTYNAGQRYFGYRDSSGLVGGPWVTRPSGLVQSVLAVPNYKSDPRWTGPVSWYKENFDSTFSSGQRSYYGWLSFVKAMRLSNTDTFDNGFDWYRGSASVNGLAKRLVDEQQSDGSWPQDGQVSHPGYYGENFVAGWAIQMLKPALFAAAPIACFDYNPKSTYSGDNVTFNPSCSGHSETGKSIANLKKFEWDFNNDGTYEVSTTGPTVQTETFTCGTPPCTFPITLRVTDDGNPALTATARQDVVITNPPHPPVAKTGGPYIASLCAGDTLRLDGSASFDPNEGVHEAGCTTCPNDTITAWGWDLAAPLNGFADQTGAVVTMTSPYMGDLTSAGVKDIGLRVWDNTALAFKNSGQPNLTGDGFGQVRIYSASACNLTARGKAVNATASQIQLVWTKVNGAASYDIYRSTNGPNTGFVKINKAPVTSTYSSYLDTTAQTNVQYWYRVMPSNGGASKAVAGKAVR